MERRHRRATPHHAAWHFAVAHRTPALFVVPANGQDVDRIDLVTGRRARLYDADNGDGGGGIGSLAMSYDDAWLAVFELGIESSSLGAISATDGRPGPPLQ